MSKLTATSVVILILNMPLVLLFILKLITKILTLPLWALKPVTIWLICVVSTNGLDSFFWGATCLLHGPGLLLRWRLVWTLWCNFHSDSVSVNVDYCGNWSSTFWKKLKRGFFVHFLKIWVLKYVSKILNDT